MGNVSLAGRTVVIDPGHNGGNASAPDVINALVPAGGFEKACDTAGTETDAGYPEHAFTFDVSNQVAALLRAQGARVVLTRSNDTGVGPCVNQRAAIGNAAHADVALSIHADGGPASGYGFHVIIPGLVRYDGTSNSAELAPSEAFGLDLRNAFEQGTGERTSTYLGQDGIDQRTDLGGLNLSTVPKVFIECANMRNAVDASKLTSALWRSQAAAAIAAGIVKYLQTLPAK